MSPAFTQNCVRQLYARNATTTPKGRISESTLFHLPGHIYGSVDSCIPTALQIAANIVNTQCPPC